jgi:redox-sensitive bicupin YhaK (pirin superfamily)
MSGNGTHGQVVIRSSHEDLDEPTSHLLMPTVEQGPFLPFERFAETLATRRTQLGLHPHRAEEVVTYVLDGYVHHEDGSGTHTVLAPRSVLVVTAHTEIRHDLMMQPSQQGRNAKWLSIVLRLPWHTEAPPNALQVKDAGDVVEAPDGLMRRPVTGPLARAETFMGLECTDIEFAGEAEASFSIARKRRGVAYVLRGSGMIEKNGVEMGQGALFENVTRLSIRGSPGFRVFLATVPLAESRAQG